MQATKSNQKNTASHREKKDKYQGYHQNWSVAHFLHLQLVTKCYCEQWANAGVFIFNVIAFSVTMVAHNYCSGQYGQQSAEGSNSEAKRAQYFRI